MSKTSALEQIHADSEESEESKRLAAAIDRFYANATNLNLTHIPVALDLIILHKLPDVALYLATTDSENKPTFKVFRSRGLYLSQVELDNLSRNGIQNVYLQRSEVPIFTQYVEELLTELRTSSPMVDDQKVNLLRKSAITVMSDIFEKPTPENIQRGVKVVSNFVYVLMRDPKAYQMLLSLSSHDHYTLQHSVGVATNAIILAKKFGINDEASLIEVGIGGLLHDIGKTKVPAEIINKKGPLDESEWAQMKKHSLFGYEILKDNPNVGMRAKLAVLQHHEDSNGSGYPMGLSSNQVDLFAKIVTLADIYNAITTDRSYSKAKPPFEAFALIKDKLFHKVDPKLFEAMVLIYGGKP
ncbi:MAG: HD-GYP domain-containing protein [Bdellovibrionota bacterium]